MEYQPMIRDLPAAERPRERLLSSGARSLSNAELLAILLRTGLTGESVLNLASRLLAHFKGLPGLARAAPAELCALRGISQAKACQLLAALELGRRVSSLHPEDRAVVRSPQDVANLLQGEMAFLDQEHLRVVLLNTKNQVLGVNPVYVGNVNTSVVRAAEVFRPAIRENCPALIIVHNHPSGDPTPSQDDIRITEEMAQAGQILDIEVLDHLIIAAHGFTSLKERGIGFKKTP